MTFEELLQKVREARNLHHVIAHAGMTYLTESWVSDTHAFGIIVKHHAQGFENIERKIVAFANPTTDNTVELVSLRPDQFFMLREEINLRCEPWEEDK